MQLVERYMQRHTDGQIHTRSVPDPSLGIVLVIPSFHEGGLTDLLLSLDLLPLPEVACEVIVVVNDAEATPESIKVFHRSQVKDLLALKKEMNNLKLEVIHAANLPDQKAGVGLARKLGMDEALRRFAKADNLDGVILCLDADCRVEENYFPAVHHYFRQNLGIQAASLKFAHPYDDLDNGPDRQAIVTYELHLRYYIQAQRYARLPFAYHTVGSAMAVRAGTYAKTGGMNTRKAGEDFYFLQKCIEHGSFGEVNTTTVYPSPRISTRVPFGTGRAMWSQLAKGEKWLTYAPEHFDGIRHFVERVQELYTPAYPGMESYPEDPVLKDFLVLQDYDSQLELIRKHTASDETFRARFFRWFNAFRLMKYLHFARERGRPDIDVQSAASRLLHQLKVPLGEGCTAEELLEIYREIQQAEGVFGK